MNIGLCSSVYANLFFAPVTEWIGFRILEFVKFLESNTNFFAYHFPEIPIELGIDDSVYVQPDHQSPMFKHKSVEITKARVNDICVSFVVFIWYMDWFRTEHKYTEPFSMSVSRESVLRLYFREIKWRIFKICAFHSFGYWNVCTEQKYVQKSGIKVFNSKFE